MHAERLVVPSSVDPYLWLAVAADPLAHRHRRTVRVVLGRDDRIQPGPPGIWIKAKTEPRAGVSTRGGVSSSNNSDEVAVRVRQLLNAVRLVLPPGVIVILLITDEV